MAGVLGQRAAIVVAASGLALSVALPTTSAMTPASTSTPDAAKDSPSVSVAADAAVDFSRASIGTEISADDRLDQVVVASSGDPQPAAAEGTLSAPLDTVNMTSGFGSRINPLTGAAGEVHTGQDFGISCGTDVHAAASGVVESAGWHAYGGGNRIVIDHGHGLKTTYNHLSGIGVQVGDRIERGQTVGQSGSTGASTGCHLHFEVMVDGEKVDPLGWL